MRPALKLWSAWVLASTVGTVLFFDSGALVLFVGYAALMLSVAVPQWLVLRAVLPATGWWIPASVVGLLAGGRLANAAADEMMASLFSRSELLFGVDPLGGLLLSAIFTIRNAIVGAGLGLAQSLILRRQIGRRAWCWPAATAAGLVAMFALAPAGRGSHALAWALSSTVYGAVTGATLVWLLQDSSVTGPWAGPPDSR